MTLRVPGGAVCEWGRETRRSGRHSRELDSGQGGLVILSRGPEVTGTDADLENPDCVCSAGFSALMRRREGGKVCLVSAVVRHSR